MTPKPGWVVDPGRAQGEPADCLGGVRPEGGVSLIQAVLRNVGTWLTDVKGDDQAGSPREVQSTDAVARDGVARSSEEAPESGWSEGATLAGCADGPTSDGRSPWA